MTVSIHKYHVKKLLRRGQPIKNILQQFTNWETKRTMTIPYFPNSIKKVRRQIKDTNSNKDKKLESLTCWDSRKFYLCSVWQYIHEKGHVHNQVNLGILDVDIDSHTDSMQRIDRSQNHQNNCQQESAVGQLNRT